MREIPASPSAVFRGVSYLLHPGHEYELGPSRSGIGARPISCTLAPWATVSCCSGSSHCSALCNYTVYSPPPLYSFSESVTPLPSLPVHFCSTAIPRVVQRTSRRPWSRRGRRLRWKRASSSTPLAISRKSLSDFDFLTFNDQLLPVSGVGSQMSNKMIWKHENMLKSSIFTREIKARVA